MSRSAYTFLPPQISPRMILSRWPELRAEELEWIEGKMHRLQHAIVTRCRVSREEATRQILDFVNSIPDAQAKLKSSTGELVQ